jgi:hypothetical protein
MTIKSAAPINGFGVFSAGLSWKERRRPAVSGGKTATKEKLRA